MYRSAPFRSLVLSLLASTAFSGHAVALEPSGSAVNVDPAVSARGGEGSRVLEVKGAVFMGDEIVAGPHGLAQIRFIDDTKLVVGPNSRLIIDKFVFNADNTAREVSIDMVKGTFRFISGRSSSSAYQLRTPAMSIGAPQDTAVDVTVERGGRVTKAIYKGSTTDCDGNGACVRFETCTIAIASPGQPVTQANAAEVSDALRRQLPFAGRQLQLLAQFRVKTSGCAGFSGTGQSTGVRATRTFMGPNQYPPANYSAFGIVAFPFLSTPDTHKRFMTVCRAYWATLVLSSATPVPAQSQMVTMWTVSRNEIAAKILDESSMEKGCQAAVDKYDLPTSQRAIDAVRRTHGAKVQGRGPYLLAWSPGREAAREGAAVLVLNLSTATTERHFLEKFEQWRTRIQQNPELYPSDDEDEGWSIEVIREQLRNFVDVTAQPILELYDSGTR